MSITGAFKKLSSSTKKTATKTYVNRKIANIEGTAKKELLNRFGINKLEEVAATRGIKLTVYDSDKEKFVTMTTKAQIVKKLSSKMKYPSVINACKTYGISYKLVDNQVKDETAQLKKRLK